MAGSMSSGPPARESGECTMCCKVMGIEDLEKPTNSWCKHCTSGRGCGIYEARPAEGRAFVCAWLQSDVFGEEWKPSRTKFEVWAEPGNVNMKVSVDPARPDAWRKEPFYSYFKAWVRERIARGGKVVIVIGSADTPTGPIYDARKLHKDDPGAQVTAGG